MCMAGARITGQVAVNTVVVKRSSAIPADTFARKDAVAGATTIRSADFARATCFTPSTSVNRSGSITCTLLCERASSVVVPIKRVALSVATT